MTLAMVVCFSLMGVGASSGPSADEFIVVAQDQWHFAGAASGARYIPFGSNFVLEKKAYLDLFGPIYDAVKYDAILAACAGMHINCVKVFLPIAKVLPDPQPDRAARIAPDYLDHVEEFLGLCRKHDIRVILALASWGGNGLQWWQEGGQYYGRKPWRSTAGPDSLAILVDFWRQVGTRFKENPTIFALTPCVEWTFPCANLTWFPPTGHSPVLKSEAGLFYWRAWLRSRYEDLAQLNAAWGSSHSAYEAVPLPDYGYDKEAKAYHAPRAMIRDYQDFREWSTMRYLRPQLAAMKAAAPKHLRTISNQMRSWNLWPGAAKHFLGTTPIEQKEVVDFVTLHGNFRQENLPEEVAPERLVQEIRTLLRFVGAGKKMPVVLEEFSFSCAQPERVALMQQALVEGAIGYASGWLTWYLFYPEDAAAGADSKTVGHESSWMDVALKPSPWGEAARLLYPRILATETGMLSGIKSVSLERQESLVPLKASVLLQQMRLESGWLPMDFEVERCRYHHLPLP